MERLDAPDRSNKESSEEVVTFRNLDSLDVSGFEEKVKKIKDNFSYVYPYDYQTKRRTKVSISEIKRAYYEELKKESEDEVVFTEKVYPVKPKFISNEEEKSGARIGTMYHRIFELFDYNIDFDEELLKSGDYSQIKNMIDSFADRGLINGDEYEEIPLTVYARFILSPMYEKLREAHINKTLRREQKFIFTTKASSISKEYKDDDPILIQGIIDAFYEKDGKVTIIDYKSDNVSDMKELKKKYEVQLQIYKRAVAQILQNDNVESFIYSTYLGDSIEI
jgi:ATP-dependent helicase/nuclease subunit A